MLGLCLCPGCLDDLDRIEERSVAGDCDMLARATRTPTRTPTPIPIPTPTPTSVPASASTSAKGRCTRCGLPASSAQAPCWACIKAPPPFARALVAMPYTPPYDTLVGRLKHRRQLWVANCLASLLARVAHDAWEQPPDLLVPIPASQASLTRRGFNPAGELCRALGRRLRVPVSHTVLGRTRDGPKQSELGRLARLVESVDLFRASRPLHGLHVGLVDDVMTTGGTLSAATEALLDRGCAQVTVLVAARTVR
ncbi:MAG: phosphoribosyltransferase family protein [Burkholderiaceae bacterium]